MYTIYFLAFLLCVCYPVYHYESARFQECLGDCREQYIVNTRILKNPICDNPAERVLHGKKAQLICLQAQKENRQRPSVCALKKWWQEGELYGLYYRIAGSNLMLLSIILPTIFMVVYSIFTYCVFAKMHNNNSTAYGPPAYHGSYGLLEYNYPSPPHPDYYFSKKKRKRKRYY